MKIMIAYATTEGQTRRIARRLADHMADLDHSTELLALRDANDVDLGRFDGVILAASVHMNTYQRPLTEFAARQSAELNNMPTLFLSVSLSASGHDAEDWRGLERIAEDLTEATGWTPGRTLQVAGAYVPSQYDILRGFVMRRILLAKDPTVDPGEDHEFTDWTSLFGEANAWLASIRGSAEATDQKAAAAVSGVPA